MSAWAPSAARRVLTAAAKSRVASAGEHVEGGVAAGRGFQRRVVEERVAQAAALVVTRGVAAVAEVEAQIGARVEVDGEHAVSRRGDVGGHVGDQGGLPDTAFGVDDGDDVSQLVSLLRCAPRPESISTVGQ